MHKLLPILLLGSVSIQASNISSTGARPESLGGAGITLRDPCAVFYNPAAITDLPGISAAASIQNQFEIPELNRCGLSMVFDNKVHGAVGGFLQQGGYRLHKENRMGVCFARKFGEKFSAGLLGSWFYSQTRERYDGQSLLAAEAGFRFQINKELVYAGQVFTSSGITSASEDKLPALPASLKSGLSYSPNTAACLLLEVEKATGSPPLLRCGIEYQAAECLWLRAGLADLVQSTCGIGYRLNLLRIDLSIAIHASLGYSSEITLSYVR